jgi:hypothetical protein
LHTHIYSNGHPDQNSHTNEDASADGHADTYPAYVYSHSYLATVAYEHA